MTTVIAVYENGVLRPKLPLDLPEGQEARLSLNALDPFSPSVSNDEYLANLKAAKSIQELFAVIESGSSEREVDPVDAINESRRLTGFRVPDPVETEVVRRVMSWCSTPGRSVC